MLGKIGAVARALLAPLSMTVCASVAPASEMPDCEGPPVIMMIRGEIEDRAQLRRYAVALQESGLYPRLSGYYLVAPAPVAVFEGEVPAEESVLLVRFPCLAHARAFWYSRAYQDKVRRARLAPSAGRFTVTVHQEIPLAPHMEGRVADPRFADSLPRVDVAALPQVSPGADAEPANARGER
jgi:uncharacterized protein (DUF1330 family)